MAFQIIGNIMCYAVNVIVILKEFCQSVKGQQQLMKELKTATLFERLASGIR